MQTFAYTFCKRLIQTFSKKEYRNGQKFWLKVEKDREQYEKTIIELKEELWSLKKVYILSKGYFAAEK